VRFVLKSGMHRMTVYGYARVSTDGQTLAAQDAALMAAGAAKVHAEKGSAESTDGRKALAQALKALQVGGCSPSDPPGSAGKVDARPAERARSDHQGRGRFQVIGGCLGRHHHGARQADADRAKRWLSSSAN
jgi:Resolvase, N terminal domain